MQKSEKIEDLPAYEDRKFYIAAKMQVEPVEVEKVIRKRKQNGICRQIRQQKH